MAARTRTLALAVLFLAGACHDATPAPLPPLDRFYFPTSIALRHPGGCTPTPGTPGCTQLLVASSNFDLRYDPASGGTVIAVDVESALKASPPGTLTGAILGAARVGSFTGELAVLDGETCAGVSPSQVLVTSRSQNALYRLELDVNGVSGALGCGDGCKVPLESTLADPYGVTLACGTFPAAPPNDGKSAKLQQLAFISYLRAPNGVGWLSRLDLAPGGARSQVNVGFDPIATAAFDPGSNLLFTTARFGTLGNAPLRAYSLAAPEVQPISVNLFDAIRGAELTGMALSSDGQRAYVTLRIYDADLAIALGARPASDLAAALAVIDLPQFLAGAPAARTLLRVVPVDRGASEVRVLHRDGTRDHLVALASPDEGSVTLYDDETGTVAQVIGACGSNSAVTYPAPCPPGDPALGKQPFSLAFESIDATHARLFVASFDRSWIDVLTIDPTHPSVPPSAPTNGDPITWQRIGPERP